MFTLGSHKGVHKVAHQDYYQLTYIGVMVVSNRILRVDYSLIEGSFREPKMSLTIDKRTEIVLLCWQIDETTR